MMGLVLSSLCVFAAYIAYALSTVGIPTSVSETYYLLRICGKPAWLFQAAMMACALLLLPAWLELSSPNLQFLVFLCCGSLVFVGAAPMFRLELEGKVHFFASLIAAAGALAWLVASGLGVVLLGTVPVAVVLGRRYGCGLFWAELAAFASVYAGVMAEAFYN